MFRKQKEKKEKELLDNIELLWENSHAEEIVVAYNKILDIMGTLDMYSANMVMNMIHYQTIEKTYHATVGRIKDTGGEQ